MDRPDEALPGLSATARVDWAESSEDLETGILFECNSTHGGRYAAVCVYLDMIVIEDPREPSGRAELRPREIRSWEIVEHGFEVEVVVVAATVHRARLPRPFRKAVATALAKVLGPTTLAA